MSEHADVLRGVFPVVQMPYHDDESIDFETLKIEADWLWSRGVDGLVLAMASEVLRLNDAERRETAERLCAWSQASRGENGPVIISVGAESTYHACEHARHAESVGASALMAIPPVSIALDDEQLARYFDGLLEAVALPLIVQDASGYVGRPMSIGFFTRMQKQYGDRVLFKPEAVPIGPRLSALRDATQGSARVFEGTGGIALVDSYRRGIVGTMPGSDLIDAIVSLWSALQSNDDAIVRSINQALTPLLALIHSLDAFLAIEKHLLVRQGVFKNTIVRGPVQYVMDSETRELVDRLFDELGHVLPVKVLQTS